MSTADLPGYPTLKQEYGDGASVRELAKKYGVHEKTIQRAMRRGADDEGIVDWARRKSRPVPERVWSDLVNKVLIVGELRDFMAGYDMNAVEMSEALSIDVETIRMVLSSRSAQVRRATAHRVVSAIMAYERKHGDPPDRLIERSTL